MPTYNHVFTDTITNRNLLQFSYDDEIRIVEPFIYGVSKAGKYLLSAYQVENKSQPVFGTPIFDETNWKRFDTAKIQFLKVLPDNFYQLQKVIIRMISFLLEFSRR